MLHITAKGQDYVWHVGKPLPDVHGPIVTFQADGHELSFMLKVMEAHQGESYAIGVLGEFL